MRGLLEMQAKGDLERLPVEQRRQMQRDMLTGANQLNNIVNDLLDAMAAHMDNDVIDLDDRRSESLEQQIVKQIEAIAAFYDDLARVVSDHMELDNAGKVRERKKTVVLA